MVFLRGSAGTLRNMNTKTDNEKEIQMERVKGQIYRRDAAFIYRSYKQGTLKVKKELLDYFYDLVKQTVTRAEQRYEEDPDFYDQTYAVIQALENEDYETAQNTIYAIEKELIRTADKKSGFFRYKTMSKFQ